MFDTFESIAYYIARPVYRLAARGRAERWIAGSLRPSDERCHPDAGGLKLLFERAFPGKYLPLSDFEKLLGAAGLMRDGEVFAEFLEAV
jgi:hypothetical protein